MSRLVTLLAAGAAFATLTFASAQAMPIQADPGASSAEITLVAGGCGYYRHRGPYGGCRPNYGYRRGYYRRGYYRRYY